MFRISLILLPLVAATLAGQPNTLSPTEKADGWKLLFDGKTFANWQDPSKKSPANPDWTIEDGAIKAVPKPRITEDLVSNENYGDFELTWEWKIAPGSNSGVKYRIQDFIVLTHHLAKQGVRRFEDQVAYAVEQKYFDRKLIQPDEKAQIYVVGFEYQMIDDSVHKDAQRGPKYQTGALYDMIPPTEKASKPAGEWNSSHLIVQGDHIEHWLNGVKVLDGSLADPRIAEGAEKRWGKDSPVYKMIVEHSKKECPISLQNHDDEAWFRSIKVRRLK